MESNLTATKIAEAVSTELTKRKREESQSFESNKRLKPSENDPSAAAVAGSGGGGGAADSKRDYKSESLPPLSKLSVAGVSDYLRSIAPAYAAHIQPFADNGINGAALCELTDSDLTELGVSNKFHRIRLSADFKSVRLALAA